MPTVRIMTVIGARPQFIKAAAVSQHFACRSDTSEILVHTGQHYDDNLSAVFFSELQIPTPVIHLGIGSASHGQQTGQMLAALETAMVRERPDWVLIYGDTNSTLAGALAAAKLQIPVAHVEAGLRSFNRHMPEEINRVMADHLSTLLFAPTETAMSNLAREGIGPPRATLVGDVMYDVALYAAQRAEQQSRILERLSLAPKSYIVATIHRAENTDSYPRLSAIFRSLGQVAEETPIVLPLHPRTRDRIAAYGLAISERILAIDPIGYLDMTALVRNAHLVATDSGGLQKEAFFHRVPCLTLRDETEWVELVEAGWNYLIPPRDAEFITSELRARITRLPPEQPPRTLYGDGNAARLVADALATS